MQLPDQLQRYSSRLNPSKIPKYLTNWHTSCIMQLPDQLLRHKNQLRLKQDLFSILKTWHGFYCLLLDSAARSDSVIRLADKMLPVEPRLQAPMSPLIQPPTKD